MHFRTEKGAFVGLHEAFELGEWETESFALTFSSGVYDTLGTNYPRASVSFELRRDTRLVPYILHMLLSC